MESINRPLITIITLNYNSVFLFDTINSVLSQNYPNIEYIIIDDGSDNFNKSSVELYINNNNKGNIKNLLIINNKKNIGTVRETNKANSLAKGEIVFNISADDCFANENVIEEWVNHFLNTNCDISTGLREVYDRTMTHFIKVLPNKRDIKAIQNYSNVKLFKYCEYHNIMLGSCTAKTKKCINRIGPINEDYRLIEDYPFILKSLRMNQNISFFNKKVIKYRLGGTSSAVNLNEMYLMDSYNIFKHEILPYSQNKKQAAKKYLLWKQIAIFKQQYSNIQNLYNHSDISLISMIIKKVILVISHPIIIAKRFLIKW